MALLSAFANVHPFFVHAPLVLIPATALMTWAGRWMREGGFETATRLLVVAAALGAVAAMTSGLLTDGTFAHDAPLGAIIRQHEINGIVVTAILSVTALVTIAEWRRMIPSRLWWIRAALLTWATVGTFTIGHSGGDARLRARRRRRDDANTRSLMTEGTQ